MPPERVEVSRRLAACASLAAVAVAMLLAAVGLRGQLWRVVAALLLLLVVPVAGWFAVTRRGSPRYAKLVQSPDYRDAKTGTTAKLLPDLLGPDAPSYDLRFRDDAGNAHDKDQLVEVSNNPYLVTRISGFGTRPRLDSGTLGVTSVELNGAADVTALLAAEAAGDVRRFDGFTGFSATSFTVESDGPVEAAVGWTLAALFRAVAGRPTPIDETLR